MSDCLLDFRPPAERRTKLPLERLRFFQDMQCFAYENPAFSLVLTRADNVDLWGPYRDESTGTLVALCGRVALEDSEWSAASSNSGVVGGLACKAIYESYRKKGISAFHELNGNFLVVVHDPIAKKLFIVTDRCGSILLFTSKVGGYPVLGTHPDVLAEACDLSSDLDFTSLGEFLSTGKVSFPHTYYRGIKASGLGTVHEINLSSQPAVVTAKYFDLKFSPDASGNEWELAERLADAFKKSVHRRTNPMLGQAAISLSGGLDSRMILCAARPEAKIRAFTFFDSENVETEIAARIARARGIELLRMRRDPEHYGSSARLGTRILAGMGSLASNHYLGFRKQILDAGFENILTGCYCDYFFKALALNRRISPLLRSERPGPVGYSYYRPVFQLDTSHSADVRERLDAVIGHRNGTPPDEYSLGIESRRVFPILYEPDSAQRGIPQRVLGWYLPVVDNDIVDAYLSLPPSAKFNASVYSKAVTLVCGADVCRIPDANTGAAVGASRVELMARAYKRALENRYHKFVRPKLATLGSWPNWNYYLRHSPVIRELWMRPTEEVRDVLVEASGMDPFLQPVESFAGEKLELFVRILTLKLWREGCASFSKRGAWN